MSIKFSIPTIAFAALLTLAHSSIAAAEVYKTSKDQVVVTGLTAKQKYPITGMNAKNKAVKRQDVAANGCGEALVNGAGKYKSLVVGTEAIDPATLPTKTHANCKPKKKTAVVSKKTKKTTTTTTTTGTTTVPASTTPTVTPVTTTPATK
ncbi:hypothetical protein [Chamaesiphon sp. OTE_75_metabat_556]|uniref:hypothetical protein n=1 Tax=Chamaesiphon sp. OTE_75_metabat_556 TaxID=2964692 RepID=UPI00286D463F|nr:hypothetical protein [Chamaesiphon sp. OTE_75_metabat_556]